MEVMLASEPGFVAQHPEDLFGIYMRVALRQRNIILLEIHSANLANWRRRDFCCSLCLRTTSKAGPDDQTQAEGSLSILLYNFPALS